MDSLVGQHADSLPTPFIPYSDKARVLLRLKKLAGEIFLQDECVVLVRDQSVDEDASLIGGGINHKTRKYLLVACPYHALVRHVDILEGHERVVFIVLVERKSHLVLDLKLHFEDFIDQYVVVTLIDDEIRILIAVYNIEVDDVRNWNLLNPLDLLPFNVIGEQVLVVSHAVKGLSSS